MVKESEQVQDEQEQVCHEASDKEARVAEQSEHRRRGKESMKSAGGQGSGHMEASQPEKDLWHLL